jgi:hypothetical protein
MGSARKEVMKGISFGKRGEVGSSGEKAKSKTAIITIAVMFILLSAGVVIYYWASSESGQIALEKWNYQIRTWTAQAFGEYFGGLKGLGSGDMFNYQINSESETKGIVLTNFKPIGSSVIPAGKDFDLIYDIDFVNINEDQSYEGEYYCSFNTTNEDVPTNEERFGTIIPEGLVNIRKDDTVMCRIPGEETEGLKGAYSIRGSLMFETETLDASMPVYFIPGEVADALIGRNFFDAYGFDISSDDLRVVYNGEPMGIAMGIGGTEDMEQPVVVRTGDVKSYNTVGITLTNEWGGEMVELERMTLTLPESVTLDDELNGEPSLSCPFVYSEGGRGYNEYVLDDDVSGELFDYYIKDNAFFGKENYRTFQCWINVDESIFGDSPYAEEECSLDIQYKYKLKDKITTVDFIGAGQELVA